MEPINVELLPCGVCRGERYVVAIAGGKTTELNITRAEVEAGVTEIEGTPVVARVHGSSSLCKECLTGIVEEDYSSIVDRGVAAGEIERWADVVARRQ